MKALPYQASKVSIGSGRSLAIPRHHFAFTSISPTPMGA